MTTQEKSSYTPIDLNLRSLLSNVPSKLCTRTQVVKTQENGVHITVPSKNGFVHISYTSFQIQMSSGKMLHKRSFMRTSDILVFKIILVLVFIQFWVNNFYFSFSFSFEIILVSISVLVSVFK